MIVNNLIFDLPPPAEVLRVHCGEVHYQPYQNMIIIISIILIIKASSSLRYTLFHPLNPVYPGAQPKETENSLLGSILNVFGWRSKIVHNMRIVKETYILELQESEFCKLLNSRMLHLIIWSPLGNIEKLRIFVLLKYLGRARIWARMGSLYIIQHIKPNSLHYFGGPGQI